MSDAATQDLPLWNGLLAPKEITLLAGWPKSGRTTLVLALLRQMEAGGELAGQSVRAGRALVVTDSHQQYVVGPNRHVCHPPINRATWPELLRAVLESIHQEPVDLVVIDSLFLFPPLDCHADVRRLQEALRLLRAVADTGPAFLLVHYFRSRPAPPGRRAAGPALADSVDVVVELNYFARRSIGDPRRRLDAYPRRAAPTHQVIALDSATRRYTTVGPGPAAADTTGRQPLRALLAAAPDPLTAEQILAAWPPDHLPPCPSTLSRWLQRDVALGVLHRHGAGRRNQPFRYGPATPPTPEPPSPSPSRHGISAAIACQGPSPLPAPGAS